MNRFGQLRVAAAWAFLLTFAYAGFDVLRDANVKGNVDASSIQLAVALCAPLLICIGITLWDWLRPKRESWRARSHKAQLAAVQGGLLFLWDLDTTVGVIAGTELLGGMPFEPGLVVTVRYDRHNRPIDIKRAGEHQLTSLQREVMLDFDGPLDAESAELFKAIWEEEAPRRC